MNNENIEERLRRLEMICQFLNDNPDELKKFNEYKEKVKNKTPLGWKPEKGEEYLRVGICASIEGLLNCDWSNDWRDRLYWALGNCFKVEVEAEAYKPELEKRLQKLELDREVEIWKKENDDVKLNWSDKKQAKYYPFYDHNCCSWDWEAAYVCENIKTPHFSSIAIVLEFIKYFGDRLNQLFEDK